MKIFDAHFHIIDFQYPIIENNGYVPPEFTVEDYKNSVGGYQIKGGVVVSGSFQAFDEAYLIDALEQLGDNFFGVANIPKDITDAQIENLNAKNVVAVRFNLRRGGSESVEHLAYLSDKLYEKYGWHTELYIDSKDLMELNPILKKLKCFSIDHLGLSKAGLKNLYYWVEKGIKVKATGFGRTDFDPIGAMKQIYTINPSALMFGTDLPSTRAKIPFSKADIVLIERSFNEEEQERIFYSNAQKWYKKLPPLSISNSGQNTKTKV